MVAVARGSRKIALLEELGADLAIDSATLKEPLRTAVKRIAPKGAPRIDACTLITSLNQRFTFVFILKITDLDNDLGARVNSRVTSTCAAVEGRSGCRWRSIGTQQNKMMAFNHVCCTVINISYI